jgi:MFS family permease
MTNARETDMTGSRAAGPTAAGDASASELVKQLSEQTSLLVRQEMELAKVELAEKGKQAGIGAGLFGGAGALGLYALGALTAAIIAGIAEALPVWASALIVAALYGAVAGILALRGKKKVQQATPPLPEETVQSVKEDVRYTKQRAQEARQ